MEDQMIKHLVTPGLEVGQVALKLPNYPSTQLSDSPNTHSPNRHQDMIKNLENRSTSANKQHIS